MAPDSRNSEAASPFEQSSGWRRGVIAVVNALAVVFIAPLALLTRVERAISVRAEGCYVFGAQALAGIPGFPGVVLRRAYYWWTLDECSLRVIIGYGSYFSRRDARVSAHVYIGPYAVIGAAEIGAWALIGTRASLLSGGRLHLLDDRGRWLPSNLDHLARIKIGAHAWVGEGAIVMANVGAGAMVAAGAVVSSDVVDGVMVAGNPARFVKHLERTQVAESL